MSNTLEKLEAEGFNQVRERYQDVDRLSSLGINAINRRRDVRDKYSSLEEFAAELLSVADAIAEFAVEIGLLSKEQIWQVHENVAPEKPEFVSDRVGDNARLGRGSEQIPPRRNVASIRRAARRRVREWYEMAAAVSGSTSRDVDDAPYHNDSPSVRRRERELGVVAAELSTYAVCVGLLAPEDVVRIIREVREEIEARAQADKSGPGSDEV